MLRSLARVDLVQPGPARFLPSTLPEPIPRPIGPNLATAPSNQRQAVRLRRSPYPNSPQLFVTHPRTRIVAMQGEIPQPAEPVLAASISRAVTASPALAHLDHPRRALADLLRVVELARPSRP